jgi:hypothetical protein
MSGNNEVYFDTGSYLGPAVSAAQRRREERERLRLEEVRRQEEERQRRLRAEAEERERRAREAAELARRKHAAAAADFERRIQAARQEAEVCAREAGAPLVGLQGALVALQEAAAQAATETLVNLAERAGVAQQAARAATVAVKAAQAAGAEVAATIGSALAASASGTELQRAAKHLGSPAMVGAMRDLFRRIDGTRELLQACDGVRVELSPASGQARLDLEETLKQPPPDPFEVLRAALTTLENHAPELRAKLDLHRRQAHAFVASLTGPTVESELETWRSGFAREVAEMADQLGRGIWEPAFSDRLSEIEAFLETRAQCRLDLLAQAARASGLEVGPVHLDPAGTTWILDMTRDGQLVGRASEPTGSWLAQATRGWHTRFEGPHNWRVSDCERETLGPMADWMRQAGCPVTVRTARGEEQGGKVETKAPRKREEEPLE